ncbi:MAG TPA: hypothetical protein VGT44_01410 [Ktedonobacteraceae bacterium]|nr:hypothetical protein [Ktedonobacteraceae bacterium]
MLRTISEQQNAMYSAFDDQSRNENDFDSPTDPMIPVILAPHSPDPTDAAHAAEPTAALSPVFHPFQSAPETPLDNPVLPSLPGVPAQPRRSPAPTVVGVCFVAVQIFLLVRVILLLFNVSSSLLWAKVLYAAGGVFALPFRLLLDQIQLLSQLGPGVVNYLAPLAAILVYGLISRILVRFLKALLNSR